MQTEMRSARLQAQDLTRTNQFLNTLLSKSDVKDLEKSDGLDSAKTQHMVNGGIPFRPDPKNRFSEPPAPPPQQPLPEKPTVPSLKRGPTERPKSGQLEAVSPIRQESQIVQLTEALNNVKRDFDTQTARMKDLEEMLEREKQARELAEDLAKRLEESATTQNPTVPEVTSEIPAEESEPVQETPAEDEVMEDIESDPAADETKAAQEAALALQARIDNMEGQMQGLRDQVEQWKQRCELAESERDADRKTLAEMVVQLRAEEARRVAAQQERRSRSRQRETPSENEPVADGIEAISKSIPQASDSSRKTDDDRKSKDISDEPTLSRANTITPMNLGKGAITGQRQIQAYLPYASAMGVVLIGMGLMAYINGWEAPPSRIERQ